MIYQKILEISKTCSYIFKDTKVGDGNFEYKAVSDEQVKILVRDAMLNNGVVGHVKTLESSYQSERWEESNKFGTKSKQQIKCSINGVYVFIDTEDNSTMEVPFFGYGIDSADKADGKALTYALKYMYLSTFIIPTGLDKDKVHSEDIETPPKKEELFKPNLSRNLPFEKDLYDLLVFLHNSNKISLENVNKWFKGWNKIIEFDSHYQTFKQKYSV